MRKTGIDARGLDADAHLLAHDRENRDLDLVSDHDALVWLAGENQHRGASLPGAWWSRHSSRSRRHVQGGGRVCRIRGAKRCRFNCDRGQVVSAPLGTPIPETTAEPDPDVGPPGANRRLDRPPARRVREGHLGFKREHELEPGEAASARATSSGPASTRTSPTCAPRTRRSWPPRWRPRRTSPARRIRRGESADGDAGKTDGEGEGDTKPRRRRRGRRGGRGRGRARKPLDGTFDHGDEGYGLWLDPAVQDDPLYAEHWAGHRPVTVAIEPDRIVITRAGEDAGSGDGDDG